MNITRIETTILIDGELHLSSLPVRKGDRIEAILLHREETLAENHRESPSDGTAEIQRETARQEFLELAKTSALRSSGPYPTREELHERP